MARPSQLLGALGANLGKVILGQPTAIRWLIASFAAGGHVLLEDMPGTGKTTLANALARSVDANFKRVQFTADLLPSDIIGVSTFDPRDQAFHFHEGPVFSNILLADEINRASPRTQSALLEAMAEGQVTAEGVRRVLPEPFFVVATQNPVESAGTYPLPEAQLDRFAIRFGLGYVSRDEEVAMLSAQGIAHPLLALEPVAQLPEIVELRHAVYEVRISDAVRRYIVDMVAASAVFGLNTKDTLIYQIFGLALGLILAAAIASWRFGLRASVTRSLPHVATAGVPFEYSLTVRNAGTRSFDALRVEEMLAADRPTPREFVTFKVREDRTRNLFDRMVGYPRWVSLMRMKVGARPLPAQLAELPPGAARDVRMRCMPLRRGELRFEAVSIGRAEPLGLMRSLRRLPLRESLIVMPRTYPVSPLHLPGSRRLQPGGVAFAGRIGDAEEFMSLRDYRPGDTPRRIHWKAWARTGRLVIKEYQDEFFVRHALLLDTFPSGDTAPFG